MTKSTNQDRGGDANFIHEEFHNLTKAWGSKTGMVDLAAFKARYMQHYQMKSEEFDIEFAKLLNHGHIARTTVDFGDSAINQRNRAVADFLAPFIPILQSSDITRLRQQGSWGKEDKPDPLYGLETLDEAVAYVQTQMDLMAENARERAAELQEQARVLEGVSWHLKHVKVDEKFSLPKVSGAPDAAELLGEGWTEVPQKGHKDIQFLTARGTMQVEDVTVQKMVLVRNRIDVGLFAMPQSPFRSKEPKEHFYVSSGVAVTNETFRDKPAVVAGAELQMLDVSGRTEWCYRFTDENRALDFARQMSLEQSRRPKP